MALNKSKWKPEGSLGGLIISLSIAMTKAAKNSLRNRGLDQISFPRFWALHALSDAPKSQAELSSILSQAPPSIMQMLDLLYAADLIEPLKKAPGSKRKLWILTKKGHGHYKKSALVLRQMGNVFDKVLVRESVSDAELDKLKGMLRAFKDE